MFVTICSQLNILSSFSPPNAVSTRVAGTWLAASYPHSGLGKVGPHGDLLPRAHVRVAVPLEGGLQLLELLAGEVSPLPPLLLLFGVVSVAVIAAVLGAPLLLCGSQHSGISASSASSGHAWTSRISELIFSTFSVIITKGDSRQFVPTRLIVLVNESFGLD